MGGSQQAMYCEVNNTGGGDSSIPRNYITQEQSVDAILCANNTDPGSGNLSLIVLFICIFLVKKDMFDLKIT